MQQTAQIGLENHVWDTLFCFFIVSMLGYTDVDKSKQELTAFESSSINNLMLIEIALMDFVFFKRSFSAIQMVAILIVLVSILSIQRKKPFRRRV